MNAHQILPVLSIPLWVALFAAPLAASGGEVLLKEGFSSYATDAELDAAWPRAGNAVTHLAVDPVDRDNRVVFSKGDRRTRAFPSVIPTDDRPLRVSVDYFDEYREGVPGREYIGLWAGLSDPRGLIEVGTHHHLGAVECGRYTARVLRDEAGWFDLKTEREAGWRKIQLWVFARTVEIYIDGELDTVVEWAGGPLSVIRLGGGFGSGDSASMSGVYYDNVRIERMDPPGEEGTSIEVSRLFVNPALAAEQGA